ncbi:STM4015 family protein [Streptomyces sp. NPDC000229]|uniref:STM4015 family protein n=1 Tax=Streptomyces sp. NPDC000229 TaxID=3154247 RepID=UPI0033221A94
MSYPEHLRQSYGLPVFDFPLREDAGGVELPAADSVAWRVSTEVYDSEEGWPEAFARFCAAVDTTRVRALVTGPCEEAYDDDAGVKPVIDILVEARAKFPALRALFIGDMEAEECEISWINQGDVTRVLESFPELEEFGARGGTGLVFRTITHQRLRSLTLETGGMPAEVVRGIASSDLPALEQLDLWLGTANYGGDSEISDVAPILDGARLPRLRHLGLRNSDYQDEIAAAVASAPVVARLESLDLSMGVLTEEGATALLEGQPLTHLKSLDLHHNYLSAPMRDRFAQVLGSAGVALDLAPGNADEEEWDGRVWRYVAVGE